MQKINKPTIAIVLALIIAISTPLLAQPTAAHDPAWEVPTYAFINIAPNPIGVGQQALVVFWIDKTMPGAAVANDIRVHGYELKITDPDGQVDTMSWDVITDTTSSQYTPFTPDKTGTYKFEFSYKGQTYEWSTSNNLYKGDKYLPSNASTTLTVQDEQIPPARTSYPLPTEYWTRPIEGQNTDWFSISSNWLGTGSPPLVGGWARYLPDGVGPDTSHIMWTKPIQDGGVLGGNGTTGPIGNMFYMGMTYNQRFSNPIIMDGRLFYVEPVGNGRAGGDMVAVDLRTGQELWRSNTTGIGDPSFGYYYAYDDGNQHGILPEGLLFTSNFARAYDPTTGRVTSTNITFTPSGTSAIGPRGEHLRYVISNLGTQQNPKYYLLQWNSSKINDQTYGQIGAQNWYPGGLSVNGTHYFDWNVSLPEVNGLAAPTVVQAIPGDILLGRSTNFIATSTATNFGTPNPYTFWALSLKPGQEGRLLWVKNYTAPAGNVSVLQGPVNPVDPVNRVFVTYTKETMSWTGYSLDTGAILWGPKTYSQTGYDYYEGWLLSNIAYGKLYTSNYGGILYAMDTKTGNLVFTYGNGGEGNSTNSGMDTVWGRYPIWIGAIADNKMYLFTSEHSPNTPMYKDAQIRCIDANTGKELWTIMGYGGVAGSPQMALADGYLVYLNCYDMQIYSVGRGPSKLTVSAPEAGIELGKSLIISGTVTDLAAGTKQNEQSARFPNGVACVSDESQSGWMEYVYMQKPAPTNATGVPVTIDVIDANGNYRNIGTATSDTSGRFSYTWKPDIEGTYTVIATFAGSKAYWPSSSEASFVVDSAAAIPQPYPQTVLPPMELYIAASTIAIIIAIAIVGLIIIVKKK